MTPREIIAVWVTGSSGNPGPLTDHALACADNILEMLAREGHFFKKKSEPWTIDRRNEASKKATAAYRGNQYREPR